MKIISYTLYGNDIRYITPLILNAKNKNDYYPGWKIRVYHDDTVSKEVLIALSNNQVQLINVCQSEFHKYNFAPKFWRFLPIFENDIEVLIIRDSDSIFTDREVSLVNKWLETDFDFHIIRDHQLHMSPILAGMFGIKQSFFKLFSNQLSKHKLLVSSNLYNSDQIFLGDVIYNKVITNTLIHTSFFAFSNEKFIRINKSNDSNNFIGAIYIESKGKTNIILNYDFMIGIPFWVAKLMRYKVRPVLYLSLINNQIFYSK